VRGSPAAVLVLALQADAAGALHGTAEAAL